MTLKVIYGVKQGYDSEEIDAFENPDDLLGWLNSQVAMEANPAHIAKVQFPITIAKWLYDDENDELKGNPVDHQLPSDPKGLKFTVNVEE